MARISYSLASPENNVTLPDLARLCDAFYIGGTKCGALFGEAVVRPHPEKISHLFTQIKRHGALFAKGWLIALQFEVLFSNGLYQEIGDLGNRYAGLIKEIMKTCGYRQYVDSPTNQQFFILPNRIEIFFHASVSRTEFRNSLFVIGSMSLAVFNVYNAKVE